MHKLILPLLFRLDPERAHALTLYALRLTGDFTPLRGVVARLFNAPSKPVQAFGLTFKNSVGLAAGYDKDGSAVRGLSALGFGHVEVGTVTPKPQAGNPSPRVFRLLEDEAVINRMGFPSRGAEFMKARLKRSSDSILGINLGKNKETPNEEAAQDYVSLINSFASYADYLTINISSPNTTGLRQLQERAALDALLAQIHKQRKASEASCKKRLPILVKLSPDLSEAELDDALEVILRGGMDGVIVTNTTLARDGLRSNLRGESGGLSGSPLAGKSEAVLRQTVKRVNGQIPIVSAGGIMNPEDAKRRLEMGATLTQIYTGLIYRGPALVKQINQILALD